MRDSLVSPGDEERSVEMGASDKQPLVQKAGRVKGIRLWLQQARRPARLLPCCAPATDAHTPCTSPQLEALLVKNATLTLRNKPAAVLQVLSTFIFILLIYGVSLAIEQQNRQNARYQDVKTPVVELVGGIPDCSVSVRRRCCARSSSACLLCSAAAHARPPRLPQMYMKANCYTLLWAPAGDAVAANIVANIMANNDPPIPELQVKAFATADAANAWMQQDGNFERTLGAYEFFVDYTLQNIDFGIQIVRCVWCQRVCLRLHAACSRADAARLRCRRTARPSSSAAQSRTR
jgi:hypothetical protein